MSLYLKWVSCRRHMVGSYIFIYSDDLCLSIHVFIPLMFKLITDIVTLLYLLLFSIHCPCSFFLFLPSIIYCYFIIYNSVCSYNLLMMCRCYAKSFAFITLLSPLNNPMIWAIITSIYYMSVNLFNLSLSHLILSTTLSKLCFYSHFTDEGSEAYWGHVRYQLYLVFLLVFQNNP